jgi:hypothetical protein
MQRLKYPEKRVKNRKPDLAKNLERKKSDPQNRIA